MDLSGAGTVSRDAGAIMAAAGNDGVSRSQNADRSGSLQADGLGGAEAEVEADPAHVRPAVIDESR